MWAGESEPIVIARPIMRKAINRLEPSGGWPALLGRRRLGALIGILVELGLNLLSKFSLFSLSPPIDWASWPERSLAASWVRQVCRGATVLAAVQCAKGADYRRRLELGARAPFGPGAVTTRVRVADN